MNHNAKLIFLNGAINCGKTTIGRRVAAICRDVAFVEVDDLHGFIPWMPIEKAVPLNIRNGMVVAKNFIQNGINAIFAYPLSDADFKFATSIIDFECQIESITLFCDLDENIKNRGDRVISDYEVGRIKWMHENGLSKPSFSRIIDTTNMSISEAANVVIAMAELERSVHGK